MDSNTDGVANARGIETEPGAIGVIFQDVCSPLFVFIRVFVDVGVRAHGNKHPLSILGKGYVARPVPTTAQLPSAGNIRDNHLRFAARFEITVLIGEAQDSIRVGNVDVLRVRAGRIEGNPKRSVQARNKNLVHLRLACPPSSAQDANAPRNAFCKECVTIGSSANEARILKPAYEQFHLKAGRHLRPGAGASFYQLGSVINRACGIRLRQVRCRDAPSHTRRIRGPISQCALARKHGVRWPVRDALLRADFRDQGRQRGSKGNNEEDCCKKC